MRKVAAADVAAQPSPYKMPNSLPADTTPSAGMRQQDAWGKRLEKIQLLGRMKQERAKQLAIEPATKSRFAALSQFLKGKL
jgi:hypothetical protein